MAKIVLCFLLRSSKGGKKNLTSIKKTFCIQNKPSKPSNPQLIKSSNKRMMIIVELLIFFFFFGLLLSACQRNAFSKFLNGQGESSVEKAAFW